MGNKSDSENTKSALIQAAGELFAERGYSGVTAREVAARAGASLGSIPYHFGSMETLYRETLIEACKASKNHKDLQQQADQATPQEALRLAVLMLLEDYSAMDIPWQVKLVEREYLEPSELFREVIRMKLRPDWDWLCGILGRAVDLPADSEAVAFGAITLHTQATTFLHYGRSIQELAPSLLLHAQPLEKLALVMTSLTLDAVDRYSAQFGTSATLKPSQRPAKARSSRKRSSPKPNAKGKKS
ncbi:MAG: TetR/AcrR family transcriptional regulator [Pirellula sp.]